MTVPLLYVDSSDPDDAGKMGLERPTSEDHTRLVREAWGDFTLAAGGGQLELTEGAMTHIARTVLDPGRPRPVHLRLARAL